jgi:hypothetical protein
MISTPVVANFITQNLIVLKSSQTALEKILRIPRLYLVFLQLWQSMNYKEFYDFSINTPSKT